MKFIIDNKVVDMVQSEIDLYNKIVQSYSTDRYGW